MTDFLDVLRRIIPIKHRKGSNLDLSYRFNYSEITSLTTEQALVNPDPFVALALALQSNQ